MSQNPQNPGLHPQTAMQMGNLLHKLSGHPKTRDATLRLIKEVEPGYKYPADVAVADLEKRLRAERETEKRTEQEQRSKNRRAKDRAALVEEMGEDAVKLIEEGPLKKYPHLEYKDAATLLRAETGPARPTGQTPERFRHGQIWEFPDLPGLIANPEKAASDAAYAVIDELRSR